ncbi:hypothetical protein R6Q57_019387 [Mikania cordata]
MNRILFLLMSWSRHKNPKEEKKESERKRLTRTDQVAVQWHRNRGLMTNKPRSKDVTSIIPKTKPKTQQNFVFFVKKSTSAQVLQKELNIPKQTRIHRRVRMHIRITRLTSKNTRKTMNSTSQNQLGRLDGTLQNGLRLRVVKLSPLSRQPTNSSINLRS